MLGFVALCSGIISIMAGYGVNMPGRIGINMWEISFETKKIIVTMLPDRTDRRPDTRTIIIRIIMRM